MQKLLSFSLLSKNLKTKIYHIIIFPLVLYGCETWSLTWREERRLRMFENRAVRRICGPRKDEVTGDWRKVHNEELNDTNCLSYIIRLKKSRRMRWAEHVARVGQRGGVYSVLWGFLRERDQLVEPGVKGRIILRGIRRKRDGGLDWIELAQDRDR